jgi:hypothetical protein
MNMPQIDWNKFGQLSYWLEGVAGTTAVTPVNDRNEFFFWFFLYLFASLLVGGVALRVLQAFLNPLHPFQKKFPFWGDTLIWMGILGFSWFLLRQLSVGFLGARFWLLIGGVWGAIFLYFVIRYFVLFYQLEIAYYRKHHAPLKEVKKKSKMDAKEDEENIKETA